jgi:hypothetical protein
MSHQATLIDLLSDTQRSLIDRAKMLAKINVTFGKLLPKSSRKHIVIMNIKDTSVIVAADSAVHLTHLRFEHQNLLTGIRQIPGLEGVTQLHFKIQPTAFVSQKKPVRKALMSEQTSQMIRHSAEGFEDQQLRSALVRLSKNCASNS